MRATFIFIRLIALDAIGHANLMLLLEILLM